MIDIYDVYEEYFCIECNKPHELCSCITNNEWEEISNICQEVVKRKNLSRGEVDKIIDKIFEED